MYSTLKFDCLRVKVLEDHENNNFPFLFRGIFFNTNRFITIDQLKVKKLEDLEIGAVEICDFVYRNKKYELKCEILTNELEKAIPGLIEQPKNSNTSLKRDISINDIAISQRVSKKVSVETTNKNVKNLRILTTTNDTLSSAADFKTSQSLANSTQMTATNEFDFSELSLDELFALAEKGEFPSKMFEISNKKKFYTQIMHFFNSIRVFGEHPKQKRIKFDCKICSVTLVSPLKDKSDLYKHLKLHDNFATWFSK